MRPVAFAPRAGGEAVALSALPPLALYVHVPWCLRKCPYCDFNSHEARGGLPEAAYVDALIRDLELALPGVWGRRVHTLFIGGGTPSLFAAQSIDRLLSAIRARLPMEVDAEVTLEANPGTFEREKFRDFRAAGVNRLSLGIQSFDDGALARIGRVHDGTEAMQAAEEAIAIFGNVNLDLMYALPSQSLNAALADIRRAISLGPPHLSAYHLTLEPHTAFHHQPPPLPSEDEAADMQEAVEAELTAAGYGHYETSAFAKPGAQCRHNLNYWRFGDYLGIGAGAHGKISFADRIVREARWRAPNAYLEHVAAGEPVQERREIAAAELPGEFAMNVLRLTEGVPLTLFTDRTGLPATRLAAALGAARVKGLVEDDALCLRPTLRGQRFLNDLVGLFLDPPARPTTRV